MSTNRLFEIVYLLIERGGLTAGELAERFGVTTRTVYRDIDTLSGAGVPVYCNRGRNGGIRLMEGFTLDKTLFTDREQDEILASLQGLGAIRAVDAEQVLTKLAALFGKKNTSWLDVDFTRWGGNETEKERFALLKEAILDKKVIYFDYFGSDGSKTERTAEPLRLIFKGLGWYLYAFCRVKSDYRVFKLTRIKNLKLEEDHFDREAPEDAFVEAEQRYTVKMAMLKLRIDASMAFRVYDEFEEANIEKNSDGSFTVTTLFPEGEWMVGYLLGYGDALEVLEPVEIRNDIRKRAEKILAHYE